VTSRRTGFRCQVSGVKPPGAARTLEIPAMLPSLLHPQQRRDQDGDHFVQTHTHCFFSAIHYWIVGKAKSKLTPYL